MNISGSRKLLASRSEVWKSLHNADLIRDSIKGCQSLEWNSDSELAGVIKMKVGPLNAIFKITMEICDPVEEEGYTMKGTSKAGALGFASGEADIRLQDLEDNGCELNYDAKIRVGGKIAQLGARLMGSVSKKFIDDFFIAFEEGIIAESEPATSENDC